MINAYRNVLLIAYYFPPDPASGAGRPGRLAKGLLNRGYNVRVITRADGAAYDGHVTTVPDSGSGLIRCLRRVLPYNDRIEWMPTLWHAAAAAIRREKPDVLVSTAPPFVVHAVAWMLSRRYGIPWVADFRDPLVDNPFRTRRWARPLDLTLERLWVSSSAQVVLNTQASYECMIRRYPKWASKANAIWNGFDPDDAMTALPLRMPGRTTLTHVGSVYGGRHPGSLLSAVERLIARGEISPESISLEFYGPFEQSRVRLDDPICASLRERGVLTIEPNMVPRKIAQSLIASSSHLLLLDQNDSNKSVQVPAKLFEYICTGRPILAFSPKHSMSQHILSRAGVPFVLIDPSAKAELVEAQVREFLLAPSNPVVPTKWFLETFDANNQLDQWIEVLIAAAPTLHPMV